MLSDFSLCGALLYPAHTTRNGCCNAFTLYTLLSYTESDGRSAHRDIGAMYMNIQYKYSFSIYLFRFYVMKLMNRVIHRIHELNWLETENDMKSMKKKKIKNLWLCSYFVRMDNTVCNGKPLRFDVGHRAMSQYNNTSVSCA